MEKRGYIRNSKSGSSLNSVPPILIQNLIVMLNYNFGTSSNIQDVNSYNQETYLPTATYYSVQPTPQYASPEQNYPTQKPIEVVITPPNPEPVDPVQPQTNPTYNVNATQIYQQYPAQVEIVDAERVQMNSPTNNNSSTM